MDGISDVFQTAASIKSAQLKARPGRQDWENSPDWVKYTAWPTEDVVRLRQASWEERLAAAAKLKDEANAVFEQDPGQALRQYTQALSLFVWFDRGKDRTAEDIPWVNSIATQSPPEPVAEQANQVVATLFSNAASCLLKQQQQPDAVIYAASKALDHDPYCAKALYRRARGQYMRGTSTGLEAAVSDLQAALKLEPGNTQVRMLLHHYQQELTEQNRKDAQVFGNMFKKGQLYTAEELEAMRQQQHQEGGQQQRISRVGGREGEEREASSLGDEAEYEEDDSDDEGAGFGRKVQRRGSPAGRQADQALGHMKRSLRQAQARRELQGIRKGGVLQHAPAAQAPVGLFGLPRLPWWAWALLGAHLLYRIFKLWTASHPARRARLQQQQGLLHGSHQYDDGDDIGMLGHHGEL